MEIRQNLTETNYNARGTNPRWIVIHNTANATSAEGTAYNNTKYFKNRFVSGAPESSAHYFVDDGEIVWQCVRDTDTAWHVGEAASRNGCYNYNAIGIEVCETADGWFTDKEIATLRELVAMLMDEYGIPEERVCRHHDVTGKSCPWYYVDDARWEQLKSEIMKGEDPKEDDEEVKQEDIDAIVAAVAAIGEPFNANGMYYRAHVAYVGWQSQVRDGQMAGTTGRGLGIEAIEFQPPKDIGLKVSAHLANVGWVDYDLPLGGIVGTTGESRAIEALRIYTDVPVKYRVHVQNVGWQEWVGNGEMAGTEGQSLQVEAFQMVLA
ncbi:MAG: N-acetylmuramoyl-L-alanine amidase [Atopobiaceae bacterium]|nr:N-acetylmuramoyl-L-alanine amidase [Atopobiaceae bacterium]MBR0067847.1 N-acetylmuramoyl-L-alanine amidase [Kiritimatiellia bacterium]